MSDGWGPTYTCQNSIDICEDWKKDMHRCCPETCQVDENVPFTEEICNDLNGEGKCEYPFPAVADDCYKG